MTRAVWVVYMRIKYTAEDHGEPVEFEEPEVEVYARHEDAWARRDDPAGIERDYKALAEAQAAELIECGIAQTTIRGAGQ